MGELFANIGDPDQTPRSAASDLGLHCLPITLLGGFNGLKCDGKYISENILTPIDFWLLVKRVNTGYLPDFF